MTATEPLFASHGTAETNDDYYTPQWIFDALRLRFSMDVASPHPPISYIPAARSLTIAEDGLATAWHGTVWMNPPYSNATPWVRKFIAHGNGVALVPAAKSAWFYELWDAADGLVAVPRSRQQFTGGRSISYPVVLAAMSQPCVDALTNIGRVR